MTRSFHRLFLPFYPARRCSTSSHGAAWLCVALLAAGCSSGPKPADWQLDAKGAMERSVSAYLSGNTRVEQAELARVRSALASTGRADLLATAELLHCATRVASLVFEACTAFDALRQDATAAQRAYADYLQGRLLPTDVALLPDSQRAVAGGNIAALPGVSDPLSRLVAAGVWLRSSKPSANVGDVAVSTASSQGWRRPLLAWLTLQADGAKQAGNADELARLQRRIALVDGSALAPAKAASAP